MSNIFDGCQAQIKATDTRILEKYTSRKFGV